MPSTDSRMLGRGVRVALLSALLISASMGRPAAIQSDRAVGMPPDVLIGESTNRLLTFRVQFGAPQLRRLTGGGEVFTEVTIPGLDPGSATPGAPALPVWRQLIAVPRGASARISSARLTVSD